MTASLVFIIVGVGCVIAAIVGGGIKMQHLEVKEVQSLWRQFLLGIFGVALAALGFAMDQGLLPKALSETNTTAANTNVTQQTNTIAQTNTTEIGDSSGSNIAVTNTAAATAEPAKSAPAQPANSSAPNTIEVASSDPAPSAEVRAPAPRYATVSRDDLLTALRFTRGRQLGSTKDGSPIWLVTIRLALPSQQRAAIRAVRYNFYHPHWKNPKRAGPASAGFPASWDGYGCIHNADVIATLRTGDEVRAEFSLCELWDNGQLR